MQTKKFKLGNGRKVELTETHMTIGLSYIDNEWVPGGKTFRYSATRKDVKRALKNLGPVIYRMPYRDYTSASPSGYFARVRIPNDRLYIGCQVFSPKKTLIVRRWARGAK
jgi:hypothetical protein